MAGTTTNLGLYYKDPLTDGNDTFNIQTMLNENWDKLDAAIGDVKTPASKMGLTGDLSVGAALNVLANIGNVHVWENKQLTDVPAHITENAVSNLEVFYATAGSVNPTSSKYSITYYVADSITVNDSGDITLSDPTEVTCYIPDSTYSEYYNADALKGKYIKVKKLGSSYVYNRVLGSGVFKIAQNAVFSVSNPGDYTGMVTVDKAYSCVGIPLSKDGTITYLTSTDRNAYTDGTVGNTTITYLGQLGEPSAKIEVGSYVGTGTYNSSHKNKLTFKFEPKMIIVFGAAMGSQNANGLGIIFNSYYYVFDFKGYDQNGSTSTLLGHATISGNNVSWYTTYSDLYQMNKSGSTYRYIAIG